MTAEVKVIQHVNDVVQPVLVASPQVVQNANLHQGLMMKPLLISGIEIRKKEKRKSQFSCINMMYNVICHRLDILIDRF